MEYSVDTLIENLEVFIENSGNNEAIGLASTLLCILQGKEDK